jgi:hypothetical protein
MVLAQRGAFGELEVDAVTMTDDPVALDARFLCVPQVDSVAGRGLAFARGRELVVGDEAAERAAQLGMELERIESLNDDPAFIRGLADLVSVPSNV